MSDAVTFHLPGSVLRDPGLMKPYYKRLVSGLAGRDVRVEYVVHDRLLTAFTVDRTRGFHIVDHGNARHPRILNTGIAYIYPFWNLDPWGIRAQSSVASKAFVPAPEAQAHRFADRLRRRLVEPRRSRYPQPLFRTEVPPGCIAIFLQSEQHRGVEETCYLSSREMVEAVLDREDPRPIVIKRHPRDSDPDTKAYLDSIAKVDRRVHLLAANIHDILSRAAVCVTINSAVGIEAHLHRVPVVLCGESDFHHAAVTVRGAGDMPAAIKLAETVTWQHDAFLHWYFAQNCLNATAPSLLDDFLIRVAATGFALSDLGL